MQTHVRCLVLFSTYRDSVWLLHLSHMLESVPGVQRVAVMMGTPPNKALLQQAGLLTADGEAGVTPTICWSACRPRHRRRPLRPSTRPRRG
jgi:hypothetical protein